MTKVLILNHQFKECGVYQFAKRIYSLVSKEKEVKYYYKDIHNREEYLTSMKEISPDYIIYNYHKDRTPWLTEEDIKNNKDIQHYFIFHDGSMLSSYDKYLFFGVLDPKENIVLKEKRILLPRPLLPYSGKYPTNDIITIGSFGFATDHKRFPELVKLVCDTLPEARINLHLVRTFFGDTLGYSVSDTIFKCNQSLTNRNVQLNITTEFYDDAKLLTFLAGNDINVFYYSQMVNPGISSAIDYALSVKRPIAITKNMTFRHIYSDEISLDRNSITTILKTGTKPLEKYYELWNPKTFVSEMNSLFRDKK